MSSQSHDKERLFVGTVADGEGVKGVAPRLSGVGDDQVVLEFIVRRPDADQAQSGSWSSGRASPRRGSVRRRDCPVSMTTIAVQLADRSRL